MLAQATLVATACTPGAVDGLDGPVPGVLPQPPGDIALEHGQLPVEDLDQIAQGLDLGVVAVVEVESVEVGRAGQAPQVLDRWMQPVLGQHRLDLGLEPGAQGNELGPVAHQLPQLAHRRWGDPGFGQLVEAHPVQQLLAIPVVVLHPAVAPVQA